MRNFPCQQDKVRLAIFSISRESWFVLSFAHIYKWSLKPAARIFGSKTLAASVPNHLQHSTPAGPMISTLSAKSTRSRTLANSCRRATRTLFRCRVPAAINSNKMCLRVCNVRPPPRADCLLSSKRYVYSVFGACTCLCATKKNRLIAHDESNTLLPAFYPFVSKTVESDTKLVKESAKPIKLIEISNEA